MIEVDCFLQKLHAKWMEELWTTLCSSVFQPPSEKGVPTSQQSLITTPVNLHLLSRAVIYLGRRSESFCLQLLEVQHESNLEREEHPSLNYNRKASAHWFILFCFAKLDYFYLPKTHSFSRHKSSHLTPNKIIDLSLQFPNYCTVTNTAMFWVLTDL